MMQLSKKQYYLLVGLLFIAVLYGYMKHQEVRKQQDYLQPLLMENVHLIQNETYLASIILGRVVSGESIPYAQWNQLKNAYKFIDQASYEIEKMARALYPGRAHGLENATKNTAYLMQAIWST